MSDKTSIQSNSDPQTEANGLTDEQLNVAVGGFNPQPDPPGARPTTDQDASGNR